MCGGWNEFSALLKSDKCHEICWYVRDEFVVFFSCVKSTTHSNDDWQWDVIKVFETFSYCYSCVLWRVYFVLDTCLLSTFIKIDNYFFELNFVGGFRAFVVLSCCHTQWSTWKYGWCRCWWTRHIKSIVISITEIKKSNNSERIAHTSQ